MGGGRGFRVVRGLGVQRLRVRCAPLDDQFDALVTSGHLGLQRAHAFSTSLMGSKEREVQQMIVKKQNAT